MVPQKNPKNLTAQAYKFSLKSHKNTRSNSHIQKFCQILLNENAFKNIYLQVEVFICYTVIRKSEKVNAQWFWIRSWSNRGKNCSEIFFSLLVH